MQIDAREWLGSREEAEPVHAAEFSAGSARIDKLAGISDQEVMASFLDRMTCGPVESAFPSQVVRRM